MIKISSMSYSFQGYIMSKLCKARSVSNVFSASTSCLALAVRKPLNGLELKYAKAWRLDSQYWRLTLSNLLQSLQSLKISRHAPTSSFCTVLHEHLFCHAHLIVYTDGLNFRFWSDFCNKLPKY